MTTTHRPSSAGAAASHQKFPFSSRLPTPPDPGRWSISCDPAREEGGTTVIAFWRGNRLISMQTMKRTETAKLAELLKWHWVFHTPHTVAIHTAGIGPALLAQLNFPDADTPRPMWNDDKTQCLAHVFQRASDGSCASLRATTSARPADAAEHTARFAKWQQDAALYGGQLPSTVGNTVSINLASTTNKGHSLPDPSHTDTKSHTGGTAPSSSLPRASDGDTQTNASVDLASAPPLTGSPEHDAAVIDAYNAHTQRIKALTERANERRPQPPLRGITMSMADLRAQHGAPAVNEVATAQMQINKYRYELGAAVIIGATIIVVAMIASDTAMRLFA